MEGPRQWRSLFGRSSAQRSQTLKCERTLTADEYAEICKFLEVPYGKFIN